MTRKVLCVQDNNTVPMTNCDASSIPLSSESCNNHPCDADEVYTVEPTQDWSEEEEEEEEDCEPNDDYIDEDYDDTVGIQAL